MHGCGLMHLTFAYKTQLCKGFYQFGHAAFIHLQPHHTGKQESMSLLVIQQFVTGLTAQRGETSFATNSSGLRAQA